MKKRLTIILVLAVAIALGVGLALPRTHFAMLGWFRGEAYFEGQPTSYWVAALNRDPFVGNQGDVTKRLCDGGPAAIPVLFQLRKHQDQVARHQATLAISMIDWDRHPLSPATAERLAEEDPELYRNAVGKLTDERRRILREQLSKEVKTRASKVPAATAFALGLLGSEDSGGLLQLAAKQGSPSLRVNAAIALAESKEQTALVIRTLIEGLESSDQRTLDLARHGLKQVAAFSNDQVRDALRRLVLDEQAQGRIPAATIFGQIGPTEADTKAILAASGQDSAEIRRAAGSALISSRVPLTKPTIPILLAALKDGESGEVIVHALAPAAKEDKQVLEALLRARRQDQDKRTRLAAIEELARIASESPEVVNGLLEALRQDPDSHVRRTAAEKLGEVAAQSPQVIEALREALRHDEESYVRSSACRSLGRIGKKAAPALPELIAALRNDEANVRDDAASAIGAIATNEAQLQVLLPAFRDDPEWQVRTAAVKALAHVGIRSKKLVDGVVEALKDKEIIVQVAAAEALARLDPPNDAAVGLLRDLASTRIRPGVPMGPDYWPHGFARSRLREKAIALLGALGPTAKTAVPDLMKLLDEDDVGLTDWDAPAFDAGEGTRLDKSLHLLSIVALGQIGPDAKVAVPKIKRNMQNAKMQYRVVGAQAIWRIERSGDFSLPIFIDGLKEKAAAIRQLAAEALAELGPGAKPAVPKLRELLKDPMPEVQKAAQDALAKIRPS
jgi:HEAT repeat protein